VGQLFLTSEIGWVPGTIFLDQGALSTNTTDLRGNTFDSVGTADLPKADAFLNDYMATKATMVSQPTASVSEVRQRLLGSDGTFLLLYGCQVDWDTNVVIGARRFRSNESAVAFLMECVSPIPGARVVVKTHPLDSDNKEDVLRNVVGARGSVISGVHPHTLIEAADCVAVRNSTLGFEALCYGKPVMALEEAKYSHPGLTLGAASASEATSRLSSILQGHCQLPDPVTLRRFIVHLLDRYLVPDRYDYRFEQTTLGILSHFARNESHRGLEQLLNRALPPTVVGADPTVARAIDDRRLSHPAQQSFLSRHFRRLSDRLF
jgi:hypothetical protein